MFSEEEKDEKRVNNEERERRRKIREGGREPSLVPQTRHNHIRIFMYFIQYFYCEYFPSPSLKIGLYYTFL